MGRHWWRTTWTFQHRLQQVLYHLHCLFFKGTVDVLPQLVQRNESLAEPQARGDSASAAASVMDTMSVAWQARNVVTWRASAAAKPGAVAGLMFQSGRTPWYKFLELNVLTASGVTVVCTVPVRRKGAQGKKQAEFMFGVGKGLHRSCPPPPLPKSCERMWQAATHRSSTRLSLSTRGFRWPAPGARRSLALGGRLRGSQDANYPCPPPLPPLWAFRPIVSCQRCRP